MLRSSTKLLAVLTVVMGVACEQAPTEPSPAPPIASLDFRAPILTAADLRTVSVERHPEPPGSAPEAVSIDEGYGSIPQILDARTRVQFEPGFASALGIHKYTSNVGEVATTVQVTYEDAHLGSHTAVKRIYDPYLLNPFRRNSVFAWAKVFTDHECGLTVHGSSVHRAMWEFYQGQSVQKWGEAKLTTQADPASQSACTTGTSTTQGAEQQPGGLVCYYLITYDLDTGEVLEADFLYCSSGGGEVV